MNTPGSQTFVSQNSAYLGQLAPLFFKGCYKDFNPFECKQTIAGVSYEKRRLYEGSKA